jgi:hypothetical protein
MLQMFDEQIARICAELLAFRVISRDQFADLEEDLLLLDEVKKRLHGVGFEYVSYPGIQYIGVVISEAFVTDELLNELELNMREQALLLHLWLSLVAEYIYTHNRPPDNLQQKTITKEALLSDLGGSWNSTTFERTLSRLVKLKFAERVRGEERICAGPMLWLAIKHDDLVDYLKREKGVYKAIERFQREEQKRLTNDNE